MLRDSDADHHWKLIKGYGGGPDTWCNSSARGAVCGTPSSYEELASAELVGQVVSDAADNCTILPGQCFPENDIRHFDIKNKANASAECCAACAAEQTCVGFTINDEPPACWLKSMLNESKRYALCEVITCITL